MLKIAKVTAKKYLEVTIEYDNEDGKGVQSMSTLVEELSPEYFSTHSYDDFCAIEGIYCQYKNFSEAVSHFIKNANINAK